MSLVTRGLGSQSGLLATSGLGRRRLAFVELIGQYISAGSRVWAMTADSRTWADLAVDRLWTLMTGTRAWNSTVRTRAWQHFAGRSWSVSNLRAWLADTDRSWNRSKNGD
jgi:hypothetical protein